MQSTVKQSLVAGVLFAAMAGAAQAEPMTEVDEAQLKAQIENVLSSHYSLLAEGRGAEAASLSEQVLGEDFESCSKQLYPQNGHETERECTSRAEIISNISRISEPSREAPPVPEVIDLEIDRDGNAVAAFVQSFTSVSEEAYRADMTELCRYELDTSGTNGQPVRFAREECLISIVMQQSLKL